MSDRFTLRRTLPAWLLPLALSAVLAACDSKHSNPPAQGGNPSGQTPAPATGATTSPATSGQGGNDLARLESACVDAMIKNTCTVMTGPEASQTAEVVFVAGFGAIDAKAYRELRASGEAMCGNVRRACEQSWDSPQCKTGRSLWLTP